MILRGRDFVLDVSLQLFRLFWRESVSERWHVKAARDQLERRMKRKRTSEEGRRGVDGRRRDIGGREEKEGGRKAGRRNREQEQEQEQVGRGSRGGKG
mmetsp:Transcript_11564/g.39925  ORF Transcript_11564/g.39925 Transcript_11564/m.39925 type:complete len:98 (-) Transcript_11564:826-1119(-)